MNHIKVENLSKDIKGIYVLKDIELDLVGGKIYGIVGKNGSGKTMLFRTLGGLIKPTTGKVILNDQEVSIKEQRHKIGIVIENSSLYPNFTGLKNLKFLASINQYIHEEEVTKSIIKVGLDPDDKRSVKKYSLGMKQRLAVAQAIMEQPDFLFLDEPTNALDAGGVKQIRAIIKEEAARGAVVMIASHNEEDITELCDDVFDMAEGKIYRRN